jgi:serine-type D-Ala-D-Ala carboxypeptidase/endopeptidase (penicillin-binding protein 4)
MLKSLCPLLPCLLLTACATAPTTITPSTPVTPFNASAPRSGPPVLPTTPLVVAPDHPDPPINAQVQKYLTQLAAQGFAQTNQGGWFQTEDKLLVNHQGTVPLSAASLTKVATSLAALQTFGPEHRFVTEFAATGPVTNGILKGDLVVIGNQDPFFVWEDAIAVGNLLNQLNIKQVTGNLIVAGDQFYMNYETAGPKAGALLKQGIDSRIWPAEAQTQFQTLPLDTPKPTVAIAGTVQVMAQAPTNRRPLLKHNSAALAELLKKMNRYSNNAMADMIANAAGGASAVAKNAAKATGLPQSEIQLVNGSGLSPDNKISPRMVCALFRAIARELAPKGMTIGDIFTIVGNDEGILDERKLPKFAVVKSGSLDDVSALAGVIPTQNQGPVWFVIMNGGTNHLEGFRADQETLLQRFVIKWGQPDTLPLALAPTLNSASKVARSELVP